MIVLSKFIQRRAFDLLLFGYVKGIVTSLPSVTIKDAVLSFMKTFDITEDEYNVTTGMATYTRMSHEIRNHERLKVRS